ncbi:MAG: TIGR02587 family membrane protein [Chloroflexota bacterium]
MDRTWAGSRPYEQLKPWERELKDFTRAFSGAFLFAIPLLFTMEMWWLGTYANIWRLLIVLAIALVLNLGLAYIAGFKKRTGFGHKLDQAIDAVAVGVVSSFVVLLVLNRISFTDPLDSMLGKTILQALPLSLGASAANIVFSRGESREGNGEESGGKSGEGGAADGSSEDGGSGDGRAPEQQGQQGTPPTPEPAGPRAPPGGWHATANDVGATATGGIFLGFSIAPTDEVPLLAAGLTYAHVIALIGLTLAITYGIVFASGFDPEQVGTTRGPFQHPLTETALAYIVALLISLGAVFLFQHAQLGDPLGAVITQTVVLGVPTAVGGAAGRLVI